jgi:hypothetical protein
MIKKWNEYNEEVSWFSKKEEKPSDITPKGIMSTVYPEGGKLTSYSDVKVNPPQKNPLVDDKVDKSLIQEISDRLYGPDSEEYIAAIKELNSKFRRANVLVGHQMRNQDTVEREKRRAEAERELANKYGRTNP